MHKYSGKGEVPQSGQNDPLWCKLTKETKLWVFQEFDFTPILRHQAKIVFLHKVKIISDWKVHPIPEETEYYKEFFKTICFDNAGKNKTLE